MVADGEIILVSVVMVVIIEEFGAMENMLLNGADGVLGYSQLDIS